MFRILLVEDDEVKHAKILSFLRESSVIVEVDEAWSYRSALARSLDGRHDLVLLDMSIPTFDVGPGERGGEPQPFGGRELMRDLEHYDVATQVVVLTSLDVFGKGDAAMTLAELDRELRQDHPVMYLGCVQYRSVSDQWKNDLSIHISKARMGESTQ